MATKNPTRSDDDRTRARRSSDRLAAVLPGLLVAGVAAAIGFAVNRQIGAASPLVVTIVLGVLLSALGGYRPQFRDGLRLAASTLLRIGIVLLGLQLVVSDIYRLGAGPIVVVLVSVATAFVVTRWVGRRLGMTPARSLLVATGVAICGASAVAAMNQVADGEDDDAVTAVAVVTVLGTLSLAVLPALGLLLGLDDAMFGMWIGASVHEVGQVVAIGGAVGAAALSTAVVVKLFRVVLLAPLVAAVAIGRRSAAQKVDGAKLPPILPWFVAGFLAMVALRTTGWMPGGVLTAASTTSTLLLAMAMFALGAAVDPRAVARGGRSAVSAGAIGTVVLAATSLAGLALVG
ncbi:putative sulfate exporter family transporter [Micromonospora sp. NPDC048170]|uniref:YeiH family protein n=1 Tax=Micromonospora sp. NPDC048170 TaxID=3154819 RepID=UPI0033FA8482